MKKAFTLAETLIVIAIIGVIATLTLPNVMANYKKKVYVAQLQKVYNQLSNAAQQYMVDNDVDDLADTPLYCINGWDKCNNNAPENFLKKYLKTVKTCGESNYKECFPVDNYKDINNNNLGDIQNFECWGSFAILNTGAAICMESIFNEGGVAPLFVDLNGEAGPNVYGRDAFEIGISRNGKVTGIGWEEEKSGGTYSPGLNRILNAGWKMDY